MDNNERLKFMREWLKDLEYFSKEDKNIKRKVECLSWAIKQCQKNVDRKRDKERERSCW